LTSEAGLGWSRTRRLVVSRWTVTLAAAAVAGLALRVWVYRSTLGIPNSDEALIGLMARHVLDGELTVFMWGQAYGGSQEALLAVPGFLLFGSSWLALRLVPIGLVVVAALLVWRIGLRTIGARGAAAAAALLWVWPPYVIFHTTLEFGFYASGLVYSALLLLLALRIVERPDRTRVGLFGLVLGLGFWQTAQIVPVAIPVIAWTVWRQPRCLRHAWIAVLGALVGALPWLGWNLAHDWDSLHISSGASSSYAHRLRVFVSPVLPMMLGLRTPFSQEPLGSAVLVNLVYAGLVVLFLYGAYRSRRRNVSLLYVVAAVFPFVYGLAAQTFNSSDPRYVITLTPVLVLLVAQALDDWLRATVVLALAFAVSLVTLHRMQPLPLPLASGKPTAPRELGPLVAELDRLGLDRVYSSYWLAYVLAFDTRERIVAVENRFDEVRFVDGRAILPRPSLLRSESFRREVERSRNGFVFFREGLDEIPIVSDLERRGYRRVPVGPFVIFAPPTAG
jgi:dolichyl-phosphate-mannose-protein mannosyltransferase